VVPKSGLEPERLTAADFESGERNGTFANETRGFRVDMFRKNRRDKAETKAESLKPQETQMSLVDFAKRELDRAGLFDKSSDYGGMMGEAVLKMVEQFADEGHSGFSAGMAISIFSKLSRFEPLSPLTGEDDEWMEVGPGVFQNRRCAHVFKDETGAYNIDGKVFREPGGFCYTNRDSRVYVTFPYEPSTEYVDIPSSSE